MNDKGRRKIIEWRNDWNLFAREVLKANLDNEQQEILRSVQYNPMTAVSSGTARGKDFVAAVAALCFLYLTPRFEGGKLVANTKVALTAPTGRQIDVIMIPEVSRLFRAAGVLPGRLLAHGIKTEYDEWFLTGFKADENNTEAWTGFHAVNTMFVVTEASGLSETVYNAIEGNLQGNSRLLLVFNPNTTTGYAAKAMMSERFHSFRLNSLNAENVVRKADIIPGQVNYEWVKDKVETWASRISIDEYNNGDGDFEWEGEYYRPNDLFRVKVLGMFPKISQDVLVPYEWIEKANKNWKAYHDAMCKPNDPLRLGVDVAGMGRDNSVICHRYGCYVPKFDVHQSAGQADHMHVAGMVKSILDGSRCGKAFIDTIGEGAGVFSRLNEQGVNEIYSCKFSEGAKGLSDISEQYSFANMRAYLHWCVRDWLNPKNKYGAAIPPNELLAEELTNTKWKFQSNGCIIIEPKEDIKKRLKRSPDYLDALANTFYPHDNYGMTDREIIERMF